MHVPSYLQDNFFGYRLAALDSGQFIRYTYSRRSKGDLNVIINIY